MEYILDNGVKRPMTSEELTEREAERKYYPEPEASLEDSITELKAQLSAMETAYILGVNA